MLLTSIVLLSWLVAIKAYGSFSDQYAQYTEPSPLVYVKEMPVKASNSLATVSNPWIQTLYQIAPLDAPLLDCIASKESTWHMEWNYMNPTGDPTSKYSAYGFFQITKGTALEVDPSLDRMNPKDNILLAIQILHKLGVSRWNVASLCTGLSPN